MDLSYVVPIYNTKKESLLTSIDSLLATRDITYEILLINDGSTVNYIDDICNHYSSKFSQVKYINNIHNVGVAHTRNTGIEHARGQYISFVDSDDVIFADVIDREVFSQGYDLVLYDMFVNKEKKQLFDNEIAGYNELIQTATTTDRLNSACGKLFKKQFLIVNKIRFDEEMITGEDANFVLDVIVNRPAYRYISKPVYKYKYRYATSYARTERYPDFMVRDSIRLYHKKKEIIISANMGDSLINTLDENQVGVLSIVLSDLITLNELTDARYSDILNNFKQLSYSKNFKIKTIIRYLLINSQNRRLLSLYSKIRFYFKQLKAPF